MKIRILDKNELQKAFDLRCEVFVKEQNVPPEIELDREDEKAIHIIAEDGDIPVGCARLLLSDDDAHIGRLAVKKQYRGRGIGAAVMKFIVDYCFRHGYTNIWFNAQYHALSFYEKLGFRTEGEIFYEAGIKHIKMVIDEKS